MTGAGLHDDLGVVDTLESGGHSVGIFVGQVRVLAPKMKQDRAEIEMMIFCSSYLDFI